MWTITLRQPLWISTGEGEGRWTTRLLARPFRRDGDITWATVTGIEGDEVTWIDVPKQEVAIPFANVAGWIFG